MTATLDFRLPGSHYHLLGVPHDASPADIEAACRRAQARCSTTAGRFMFRLRKGAGPRDLAEARRVLADPVLRDLYDSELQELLRTHFFHPPCF